MKKGNLPDIILSSAISAYHEYYLMTSGDCGVVHTPEYWYTTNIGMQIKKLLPELSVILECPMSEFNEYSEAKSGRHLKGTRENGRADITLWKHNGGNDWDTHCIIEVKKGWGWKEENMGKDVIRICNSIKKSDNVNIGYFVVLTDSTGSDKETAIQNIESRLADSEGFKEQVIKLADKHGIIGKPYKEYSKFINDDKSIAAAVLFEFTQSNEKTA